MPTSVNPSTVTSKFTVTVNNDGTLTISVSSLTTDSEFGFYTIEIYSYIDARPGTYKTEKVTVSLRGQSNQISIFDSNFLPLVAK